MVSNVGVIYGKVFEDNHRPWYPHPEHPARAKRSLKGILRYGLRNKVEWYKPIKADLRELYSVHIKGYVDYIIDLCNKAPAEIDSDTYVSQDSMEAILYAYGTAINYALMTYRDRKIYFAIVRPPGHHVGREGKAMGAPTQGFCIFNNVAAAAYKLIDQGIDRITIIDFDAHHGNGTQEIFYRDDRVLHIDIHQDPWSLYPMTGFPEQIGEGKGEGYSINLLLPPMAGDDCLDPILELIQRIVKEYSPKIVLVSAGFDGYGDDGFTELRLTSYSYYKIGSLLRKLNIPVLALLEGGYTLGLERGLPAFISGLIGMHDPIRDAKTKSLPMILNKSREYLNVVIKILKNYWSNI